LFARALVVRLVVGVPLLQQEIELLVAGDVLRRAAEERRVPEALSPRTTFWRLAAQSSSPDSAACSANERFIE
jgi:hypothetical protein